MRPACAARLIPGVLRPACAACVIPSVMRPACAARVIPGVLRSACAACAGFGGMSLRGGRKTRRQCDRHSSQNGYDPHDAVPAAMFFMPGMFLISCGLHLLSPLSVCY